MRGVTPKKPVTKLPNLKNLFYMINEIHQKAIDGTVQDVTEKGQKWY